MLFLDVTKNIYSYDSQSKQMDYYDSQSHATKLPRRHTILLCVRTYVYVRVHVCVYIYCVYIVYVVCRHVCMYICL